MADAAYSFFFIAVLLGTASLFHLTLQREWHRIRAALRGERVDGLVLPETAGRVMVWERPQPILQPVHISICRL